MISFIIPYYCNKAPVNTERLLHRTIKSIIDSVSDIYPYEIVIVDDGSPFPPKELFTTFQCYTIHYHCIEHCCLGGARNYGIEMAKGDYILFIDADDYYFPHTLSPCIQAIIDSQSELLMFGMKMVYETKIDRFPNKPPLFHNYISGNQFMRHNNLPGSSCRYIISRQLLDRASLRFYLNSYIEDEDFTPRLLHFCRSLIVTQSVVYAYYQHSGSITDNYRLSTESRIDTTIMVVERLLEFKSQVKDMPNSGLTRKINTLAIDTVRLSLRDDNFQQLYSDTIGKLKALGMYPLHYECCSFKQILYIILLRMGKLGRTTLHHIESLKK